LKRSWIDKAGTWHPGPNQVNDWRAVDREGRSSSHGGYFNCSDCGNTHPLPVPQQAIICPHLPDTEARTRAIGRVEFKIARARGQRHDKAVIIRSHIADEVVGWAEYFSWGPAVLADYRHHPDLESFIRALEDIPIDGDNMRPPPNARELIPQHLPLVRKLAKQRASKVDATGFLAVDDVRFSDLEEVGMRVLEEAVYRFDPRRGVPFGAFVRKRLAGEMDDWLRHKRISEANSAFDAVLNGAAIADDRRTSNAPKRHRNSAGGHKEKPYISTATRPNGVLRLIAANSLSFNQTIETYCAREAQ